MPRPRSRAALAAATSLLLLAAGCSADDPVEEPALPTVETTAPQPSPAETTDAGEPAPAPAPPPDATDQAGARLLALFMTPTSATHLTVTDYDLIRARLGVPDLTSEAIMTDRLDFWRSAEASTVLLTEGLLRPETSLFDLRYGFTQDDVRWEGRWSGESPGFVLQLRHDLDLQPVRQAIADQVPVLAEAALLEEYSTVVGGEVAPLDSWAGEDALLAVTHSRAESLMVRRGCVPFLDALGVDATAEHVSAVTAAHDVEALLDVEAVAIAFEADTARIRLAYAGSATDQQIAADLQARVALAGDWPVVETIGFSDGFAVDQGEVLAAGSGLGEIGYPVTNLVAAAILALADLVPVGVCNEVTDLADPTGLR